MVIALHTRIAGLSCKQQQPLSRWWNVAVGRFHSVFVSLLFRRLSPLLSLSVSFLKTLFRVAFLHNSQSHAWVAKTSLWKQRERDADILVFLSLCVWHSLYFHFPILSVFRSALNTPVHTGKNKKQQTRTGRFQVFGFAVLKCSAIANYPGNLFKNQSGCKNRKTFLHINCA